MRKIISFLHISLDGFVAGTKGEMDWIKADEELFKYVGKRIRLGDTSLYGRVTYQMMENYCPSVGNKPNATNHEIEHSKWYNKVHKVVISETLKNSVLDNTTIISEDLSDKLNKLKQNGDKEILLFGSPKATYSLIKQGLIDGYWLFVNPIILGQGIQLFKDINETVNLKLLPIKRQFDCGVTELNYEVER